MILLDISGASAIVRKQDILTSGMVGAKVVFCFDEDWNNLAKTAVFRAGKVVKDAVVVDSVSEIPHEVLAAPGVVLEIGVYGTADNGSVVIPTVWARTNTIKHGADPSGDESVNPSLPIWAQMQEQIVDMRVVSEEAKETANDAARYIGASMVIDEAEGDNIYLDNAADQYLVGLRIFGKTTQDGTPTPNAPVELESLGDSGNITVNVTGENNARSMTFATPNGLRGVPVASGGNYTDANGKRWICDEVDFERGVYIQRVVNKVFDGSSDEPWSTYTYSAYEGYSLNASDMAIGNRQNGYCDRIPVNSSTERTLGIWLGVSNNFIYVHNATGLAVNTAAWRAWLSEKPITIQYILATPIETALSEEELAAYAALRTYRDNTTISNDASAHMELEYVMDAKKYIDSLLAGGTSATILEATVE